MISMDDHKMKRAAIWMAALLLLLITRLILPSDSNSNAYASKSEESVESMGRNTIYAAQAASSNVRFAYQNQFPNLYANTGDIPTSLPEKGKVAYLTFDDGPSSRTKDVLDTLREKGIRATFFVVGSEINETRSEYLKQMAKDGHTIGIHTYSHNYTDIYASVESYLKDFEKVYNEVYEITGVKPNMFRFPGGSNNAYIKKIRKNLIAEMERRGFVYYDWNVSAEDAVGKPTTHSVRDNVLYALRFSYPVILMHDAQLNTITANILPELIETLKKEGYHFDTLEHRKPIQF